MSYLPPVRDDELGWRDALSAGGYQVEEETDIR